MTQNFFVIGVVRPNYSERTIVKIASSSSKGIIAKAKVKYPNVTGWDSTIRTIDPFARYFARHAPYSVVSAMIHEEMRHVNKSKMPGEHGWVVPKREWMSDLAEEIKEQRNSDRPFSRGAMHQLLKRAILREMSKSRRGGFVVGWRN